MKVFIHTLDDLKQLFFRGIHSFFVVVSAPWFGEEHTVRALQDDTIQFSGPIARKKWQILKNVSISILQGLKVVVPSLRTISHAVPFPQLVNDTFRHEFSKLRMPEQ